MLAFMILAAVANIPVSVGILDWDSIPVMKPRGVPSGIDAIGAFRTIVRGKTWDLKGATEDDFRGTTVRYAAFLKPDGRVESLLIEDVGCRSLERLVGAMALKLTSKADPTGSSQTQWYRSSVRFEGVH
jgi:hypothetical protein